MTFIKSYSRKFLLFLSVFIIAVCSSYIITFITVPEEIILLEGEEYSYDFKSPFLINIKTDNSKAISLNNKDLKASGEFVSLSDSLKFRTNQNGRVNLNLSFFGLLPLKTMKVDVIQNKELVACGNTVGVKLKIDGILVIGISDVETIDKRRILPVKDSGIKPGDTITKVNDKEINSINELIKEINISNGNKIKIGYKRGLSYNESQIQPVKSFDDNRYHIGLWVRESTAGIGTLTFYDPGSGYFGALGHGITDIDTGLLMPIQSGQILECSIVGIKKSTNGSPGELKGVFIENKNNLGNIALNSEYGIYGTINRNFSERFSDKLYPVGMRSQVKEGPAVILSNIDGTKVEEYSVEILKVSKQSLNGSKGMIIRIVDNRLLSETGGIVQGMSGSPIIQNGRIIGAITHVLVNDPTRGYGIFIEGMLKNISGNRKIEFKNVG